MRAGSGFLIPMLSFRNVALSSLAQLEEAENHLLISVSEGLNMYQYIVSTVKSAVSYVSAKSSDGDVAERTHPLAV